MTYRSISLWKIFLVAFGRYWRLAFSALHLRRRRLGYKYDAEQAGVFEIFRETVSQAAGDEPPAVLVVGFRLKYIRGNPFFHWCFQRICILTTPFWSGFPGFRIKLWMVNPDTKDYLGIYQWRGQANTQRYVDFLTPVLNFFSIHSSVWHRLYPDTELENYLRIRLAAGN